MSQEIIYTSAAKGLKPGSRGFCTVVSTAGMAKNLAERLESLSGYRHQFMPHEQGTNPVNYSHLRMTVGGKKYHVLSRICDAGLDYTKRTNKLAHHIALSATETARVPGGPAWAMAQDNFLVAKWDGEVKTLPESFRTPTSKPCPVIKCLAWEAATSDPADPGWAGVLAETAVKKSPPMTVIFKGGTDTRDLVREALALVPPEKRWNVTFTTYFTKLPAGVDCMWRFVPDGTQDATTLRRHPHARVIDLCDPALGMAPASELVDLARKGKSVQVVAPEPTPVQSGRRPAGGATVGPPQMQPKARSGDRVRGVPLESGADLSNAPIASSPRQLDQHLAKPRGSKLWTILLAMALCLLVAAGAAGVVGVVGVVFVRRQSPEIVKLNPDNETLLTKKAESEADEVSEADEGSKAMLEYDPLDSLPDEAKQRRARIEEENETEKQRSRDEQSAHEAANADGGIKHIPDAPDERIVAPTERLHKPFDDILKLEKDLRLPKPPSFGNFATTSKSFVELAKLYIDDPASCEIVLHGDAVAPRGGREVFLRPTDLDGVRSWTVLTKFENALGAPTEHGTFQLKNQSLQFRWAKEHKVSLQLCLLDITIGDRMVTCKLDNPEVMPPDQMNFEDYVYRIPLKPLKPLKLNNELPLRYDVSFDGSGFENIPDAKQKGLKWDDKATIRIPNPKGLGQKKYIEVEISLELNSAHRGLRLEAFTYPLLYIPNPAFLADGDLPVVITNEQRMPLSDRQMVEAKTTVVNALVTEIPKGQSKYKKLSDDLGREKARSKAQRDDLDKRRKNANRWATYWDKYEGHVQKNERWVNDMVSLLSRIHKDGRIKFRIYVVNEGIESDLVRTE